MRNKKIYIAIFIIFLFAFLGFSFQTFTKDNNQLNTEGIMDHLEDICKQTSNMYYRKFDSAKNLITNTCSLLSDHYYDYEDIGKILNNLEKDNNLFNRIWYLDKDKKSHNYYKNEVLKTNGNYVEEIFKGHTGISDVFSSAYNQKDIIAIYSPVYQKEEIVGGVVGIIEINDEDNNFIYDDFFDDNAYVFATTKEGQIITKVKNHNTLYLGANYFEFLKEDVVFKENSYESVIENMHNNRSGYIKYASKNNGRICFYTPVSINNWYVFTIISEDFVIHQNNQMNNITLRFTLSLMIVLFCIFSIIVYYFMKTKHHIEKINNQLVVNHKKIESILKLTSDRIFEYHVDDDDFILDAWNNQPKVEFHHFLKNLSDYEFVISEHENLFKEKFNQLMNDEKEITFDAKLPYISQDLETWFHISMIKISNQTFIGTFQNSTKQMDEYNQLLENQMFKNSVYAHASSMFALNLKSKKVIISHSEGKYKNYVDYDYENQFMSQFLKKVYEDDRKLVKDFFSYQNIQKLFQNSDQKDILEFRYYRSKINKYEWRRCRVGFEKQSRNNDIIMIAYSNNIDDEKKIQLENEYKAKKDSLTDLFNRDTFNQKVDEYLSQKHFSQQYSAYMIIDLDNFKYINDTLGHDMGDQVLRKFALILKEIFSENSYIGRFGGDEFLVFIFNQESNIEIENKANKLLEKMKEINDQYIENLSCSIGICFVENENNFENLFKKSDKALYMCKNSGKNSYKVYKNQRKE